MNVTDKTHPGFTIRCNKCLSYAVYIESDVGYSEVSGASHTVSN